MNSLIKFLLFLIILPHCIEAKYFLTVVAITKDEHAFLPEWIDYHRKMGVDHFLIYDNNDDNKTAEVLSQYEQEGLVERWSWPNLWPEILFPRGCQAKAYQDAIQRMKGKTTWMAVIDTDEFIVPIQHRTIADALRKKFYMHRAIYVNWRLFGTSHLRLNPNESLLEKLTLCSPASHPKNQYGKSIFRPEIAKTMEDPHIIETSARYVNGSGAFRNCVTHCSGGYHARYLRVNHYIHRDENFLSNVKIPRVTLVQTGLGSNATEKDFEHIEGLLRAENEEFSKVCDHKIIRALSRLGVKP